MWRARAIHTQRLSAFLPTKDQESFHDSSSSSMASSEEEEEEEEEEEDGAGSKVRSRDGNLLAAFFEPAGNGIARNPEGTGKTSEAGALLVSVQDLLTPLWRIGVGAARVLAALPAAIMAEVLLFGVGSLAVLDDVFAGAVIAGDDLSKHSSILLFGLDPLPSSLLKNSAETCAPRCVTRAEGHIWMRVGLRSSRCCGCWAMRFTTPSGRA